MNLILVSGRYAGAWTERDRDARLARDLAARGVRVRWLVSGDADHLGADGENLRIVSVPSAAPPFKNVQARIEDLAIETAIMREVRRELPDVVHQLSYGTLASTSLPWVVDRLGVPCVVSVEAARALCHRGTLVNEKGESCSEWSSPKRCATCTLTPFDGGLGRLQASIGRFLDLWNLPSPYPHKLDFENRLELVRGGLLTASIVLVSDEHDREQLEAAGVSRLRMIEHQATTLLDLYKEIV